MNIYSIPTLVNCISIFLFASFVLYQGRRYFANRVFFLAMLNVGIMEFGNFMILNAQSSVETLFWSRISLVGCCFIPANWALFSVVFARNNYERISKGLKIIISSFYIFGFLFLIFIRSNLFIYLPLPSSFFEKKPYPRFYSLDTS